MRITYDPSKRNKTLEERGLDFESAAPVFAGHVYEIEDTRHDYGECRIMCFGELNGRMVVIGYVQRGDTRHIFSMRKANEREIARYKNRLAQG
ncbi:MAG: BrnT family toxin [Magnetococcales bacterium]|nr:BrnT family toxin [Magnetococcales bacterium]